MTLGSLQSQEVFCSLSRCLALSLVGDSRDGVMLLVLPLAARATSLISLICLSCLYKSLLSYLAVPQDVIEAIAESAFKTSQYPVILSFENHVDT